jgi:transcriptional/translational regulatory protein YebC/TACO1
MMTALEAGAEDVSADGEAWQVTCRPSDTFDVKDALEAAGSRCSPPTRRW